MLEMICKHEILCNYYKEVTHGMMDPIFILELIFLGVLLLMWNRFHTGYCRASRNASRSLQPGWASLTRYFRFSKHLPQPHNLAELSRNSKSLRSAGLRSVTCRDFGTKSWITNRKLRIFTWTFKIRGEMVKLEIEEFRNRLGGTDWFYSNFYINDKRVNYLPFNLIRNCNAIISEAKRRRRAA